MDAVAGTGGSGLLQVVASACAFGLPHGIFGLLKGSLGAAVRAMIATGIMGAAGGRLPARRRQPGAVHRVPRLDHRRPGTGAAAGCHDRRVAAPPLSLPAGPRTILA